MSDLATRLRTACDQVRVKSYPLRDLIPLMQQAADALAAAPRQPAPSAAPGGFAVVPMDATDNMMAAFAKTAAAEIDWYGATEIERQEVRDGFGPAYRAMLAAAPQSSPTPQADRQPALPKITSEDRSFLHDNPNTDDIVKWVQDYARAAISADRAARAPADSVLEDAARLDWLEEQVGKSSSGISFDWVKHVEDGYVTEKGYRFMRRHFLGERAATLRAAIDAARKQGANHD